MKYLIIFNPGSKGGKNSKKIDIIRDMFDKNKIDYEIKVTTKLSDAYEFSRLGNMDGFENIIAVGGDGTINRVLNGFYAENGRRISKAKFGVIYTGTSPDFCKSYGIPLNLERAVETVIQGKSVAIDIGKIVMRNEYSEKYNEKSVDNSDSKFITNYFGCCANIGLGATLARKANSGIRKYLGDLLGTFVSLIGTLFEYRANDFTVKENGNIRKIDKMFNFSVGITKYIASGIKVKNEKKQGDKKFYTLEIIDVRLTNVLKMIKTMYSGNEIVNTENLSLGYKNEIEIYGNNINNEIEFDGDPYGFLPCRITMADESLDLIVEIK